MPTFTFTSPDGKKYDVQGPDGATKEQAFGILQQRLGSGSPTPSKQPEQNPAAFVGGNLSKGVADVAGFPVDVANTAINAGKGAVNAIAGTHLRDTEAPVGGSEWIKQQLTKIGSIGPSAEPRTPMQAVVAKGLEGAPSAVLPGGGSALGRIGAAIGGGAGGELGRQVGGTPGQIAGSVLGGGVGGLAGVERGAIPRPPSEAARASQASGIPLTLGQETGSKALTSTENRLRELFPSKGTAHADEVNQVVAGARRVDELASRMGSATGDPEAIGNELRRTYVDTVKKIDSARDAQAKIDYGAVRNIAGGKPVIAYANTLDTLDKIISENKNVASQDSARIAKQAQGMRELIAGQGTATVEDAMKTRRAWGNAAKRTGNIFSDIDPNANQVVAKRLFGAINKDFDAASTAQTPVAQALKTANANYKKASDSIDFINKSALGKLLGEDVADSAFSGQTASTKAPELIAKRYLNMQPSEAKAVTAILQQHDPAVLDNVKSFVLRQGLESAKSDVPGAAPISFAKFRREMDKVAPKLREMGFTSKEIADLKDVTDTMARAGDKAGANPSGTSGALHMGATGAAALTHPGAAVASIVAPYVLSKALLTQPGRDLVRKAYGASNQATRAAAIGALRSQYADPAARAPAPGGPGLQPPPS